MVARWLLWCCEGVARHCNGVVMVVAMGLLGVAMMLLVGC